ncbi:MAG: DUF2378 family protein [Myxococcota bacterium]
MEEPLWYAQVIEAIFIKGLGHRRTAEVDRLLAAEGIHLDKLLPGYPVAQVVRAMRKVLPLLYPGLDEDAALARLGAASMRGYSETLIGRAAVAVLKVVGVRRALERLHTSMRSGNNFLETKFTALSPSSAELHLSDVSGIPAFYRGLLEEGLRMLGARHAEMKDGAAKPPGHTFIASWSA